MHVQHIRHVSLGHHDSALRDSFRHRVKDTTREFTPPSRVPAPRSSSGTSATLSTPAASVGAAPWPLLLLLLLPPLLILLLLHHLLLLLPLLILLLGLLHLLLLFLLLLLLL